MDNGRGNLWFTIGISRCGKSTYCNRWVDFSEGDEKSRNGRPRVIVCDDDIHLELHGDRYSSNADPMVKLIRTYMARALLRRGHDVIIDETNTTKGSIMWMLDIDPDARYVLIDTPLEECERRARACGHHDLVDDGVIRRHHAQLQLLKAEGIDNVVEAIRAQVKSRRNG